MGKRWGRVKSWFKRSEVQAEKSNVAKAVDRRRARRAEMEAGEKPASKNTFVTRG